MKKRRNGEDRVKSKRGGAEKEGGEKDMKGDAKEEEKNVVNNNK